MNLFLGKLLRIKDKSFYIDYESLEKVTSQNFIEKVKLAFLDHGKVVEIKHAKGSDRHSKIIYAKSVKGVWFSFASGRRDKNPFIWFAEKGQEGWFGIATYHAKASARTL